MKFTERALRKVVRGARRSLGRLPGSLRAAIIGAGEISATHIEGFEQSGLAHVIAFCDPQPAALGRALDRVPRARAFRDVKQMLDATRPDVVSVCTWPQYHAQLVAQAAACGVRGILCEKPLALSMAENRSIVAGCQRAGVRLAGGHQYRFHPYFRAALAAVQSRQVGTPRKVCCQIRGSLANNGVHLFDSVRFLLGDREARQVACRCDGPAAELERGLPAELSATGTIDFADGITCEFSAGSLASSPFQITIEGDAGTLTLTPSELTINAARRSGSLLALMAACRRAQFAEFLRYAKGERSGYAADGTQSLKSAELVLAAYDAARRQSTVEIPLSNEGDVIGQLYPGADLAQAVAESSREDRLPTDPSLAMDGGPRAVTGWFSNKPHIGLAELREVAKVIRSGQLNCVEGRAVARLEHEFCEAYGASRAVASTSGTAALHVAVAALDLEPCDEVITTPMSDMGSVIPILSCNLIPVFADIDPLSGNLTAESIAERITPRTRAVILVHLFGRPAELTPIVELCRARGVALIEDCSQAHFAEYDGRKVGTFGDFGCFSLQQAKQITCGDGGLTLVNRDALHQRAALFVDKGWNRHQRGRSHQFLGMNYRMTELQAAVALAQLRRLPLLIEWRRRSAEALAGELRAIAGVLLPTESPAARSAWWKFNFVVDEEELGLSSDAFSAALEADGVRVNRQYLPRPLFEEEVLKQQRTFGRSRFPFSATTYRPPDLAEFPGLQEFFQRQLIIGWSSRATLAHARQIAKAVKKVAAAASRTRRKSHDIELATL